LTLTSTGRSRRIIVAAVATAAVALAPAATAGATVSAKRCGSVPFTPQSDDLAAGITAVGVSCRTARRFVRDSDGRPGRTYRGYTCVRRSVDRPDSLAYTRYRCTSGSKLIRWKRY
jgi:hypothetical protein